MDRRITAFELIISGQCDSQGRLVFHTEESSPVSMSLCQLETERLAPVCVSCDGRVGHLLDHHDRSLGIVSCDETRS